MPAPLDPVAAATERRRTRWAWDAIYAFGILAAAGVGWLGWRLTGEARQLTIPAGFAVVCFPFWIFCRLLPPVPSRREISPPGAAPIAAAVMLALVVPAAFVTAADWYEISTSRRFPKLSAVVLLAPFVPLAFVAGYCRRSHRKWQDRMEAEAVAEWDRLEASNA